MSQNLHRVLVVGGGSIGERHARCFLQTGRAAVSLCDTREEIRCALAERYSLERTFSSLDEALDESFDLAVVATPAPLHVGMARRLVAAGAHVLIEKPLSITLDGIADLQREAAEAKRIVGVAYVYRANPALAAN
jgi:predicted dehydrogenase